MSVPVIQMIRSIAAANLTTDLDLTREELPALLSLAADVKRRPAVFAQALPGRIASLLFEKPSLRTRLTFEVAMKTLGGDAISAIGPIGDREPIKDVARNLDRWTHVIVARTFSQKTVDQLAEWARVPVVNALSDRYHPCQALADMLTLQEQWGDLGGHTLAFVGDGNNVAHSLMLDAARLGLNFTVATPPGYAPNSEIVARARSFAAATGASILVATDVREALQTADAVYTDVWASMGQEHEFQQRARLFAPYQVNPDLMALARPGALFLHCLPAHRDEEVTEPVLESPASVVFDQAENRLHVQKALLLMLLAPEAGL
jgi:ornithine carbamoyltransferase